ncbi:MAG: hypothetical protein L6R37_007717 [Teloschistes peruensis]|nr:MAG: hypothetical protein L6R37_007717 [Teloschistes peruensis]
MTSTEQHDSNMNTRLLPINVDNIGKFIFEDPGRYFLGNWTLHLSETGQDAANLLQAAKQLQTSSSPLAFPTETVYGLGADATRTTAVAGIYRAKQRPADNPLIVHICSLNQLRKLLMPSLGSPGKSAHENLQDPIPAIYHSLISRFWPGPLTVLLPLPRPSPLAPAVTGSLPTFGVRMPSSRLALALIHLANVPIAAPSANVSTRPSPTTATHVLHDLSGRIELIIDGGPCTVGVESTVVDGLSDPPVILRPGGVSIEMLRQCPGWKNVIVGYKDGVETSTPRAPGMKYKHYSPRARVILVQGPLSLKAVAGYIESVEKVGLAKTRTWIDEDLAVPGKRFLRGFSSQGRSSVFTISRGEAVGLHNNSNGSTMNHALQAVEADDHADTIQVSSADLGKNAASIAKNLFAVLRELDLREVEIIFVEAIDEAEGHTAAAVMNRLRKAAELQVQV